MPRKTKAAAEPAEQAPEAAAEVTAAEASRGETATEANRAETGETSWYDRVRRAEQAQEDRDARQEAADTVSAFLIAQRRGTTLDVKIEAVEERNGRACWVSYHNIVTLVVPYEETFSIIPKELLAGTNSKRAYEQQINSQRRILTKSIGATIPVCIDEIERLTNGTYIAWGSRIKALSVIRRRYFGQNARRPLAVDDRVDAQFMSIGIPAALVTVCGCDIRVPNTALSHRYIANLSDVFFPGDKIKVQITKLAEGDGDEPEITVSARPIELEDAKTRLYRVKEKNRYAGRITSVRQAQRKSDGLPTIYVTLWLDGVDVPAFATDHNLALREYLYSGDKVYFEVSGITESGYVHGKIIRKL